ncbi:hypothetical protein WCLP8_3630027 [uncultured Gammaproteobacteria bacterium]
MARGRQAPSFGTKPGGGLAAKGPGTRIMGAREWHGKEASVASGNPGINGIVRKAS